MPTDYTPLGIALALVALAVTAVIRGWLIPRSTHRQQLQARDDQIVRISADRDAQIDQISRDRDYWRSAWMTESDSRRHADGQVTGLLELARLAAPAMQATLTPPKGELTHGPES